MMNENLHYRFFEEKLGENASAQYYSVAHKLDPEAMVFMNEYNTIEWNGDKAASPVNYRKKLEQILAYPGNEGMKVGIGLQGHFVAGEPNLAYMRSVLDLFATTGLPIWLTEVSVDNDPNQVFLYSKLLYHS